MLSKIAFIFLFLQIVLCTYGKTQKSFFRKDYTFLEEAQSFYKFYSNTKTWLEAFTTCAREGSTLFYAEDKSEIDAVLKFWTPQLKGERIFIGISAFFTKDVFTTVNGVALTDVYNNWGPGEPNNANGNEDCIIMDNRGAIMLDVSCDRKFSFICKKTLASLEWHEDCQTPYSGYVANEDFSSCYKFFLTPMKWTEAFAVCNAEESHLAVINSKPEANYLRNLTEFAPKDKVKGNYLAGVVMLGFYNRFKQGWLTIKGSSLEDSGYSSWGYAQPDVDDKYLCGAMFYNGELTYGDCSQRSLFICEKEYKANIGFDVRFGDE